MARHSNGYTVLFISAIAVICSLLLSTAATALRERQQFNIALDIKKNILKSFDVLPKDTNEVESFYRDNVVGIVVNARGKRVDVDIGAVDPEAEGKKANVDEQLYPVYVLRENDVDVAYSIPIIGKGLWSTLYGYLSLESDLNTVRGITFYKHGETPGLGAEIEAAWFQENFKGKKILDAAGNLVSVSVVKGQATDKHTGSALSHYVDGISGATITSRGVTEMLKRDLTKYEAYFATIRPKSGK